MRKITRGNDDTIAAIATPMGETGIGVVRMSGSESLVIADKVFRTKGSTPPSRAESFRVLYGHLVDPATGEVVDEALLLVLKPPRTYTREEMVEVFAHGGSLVLQRILDLLLKQGARLAEPGEFTKRAFLNGRIDLSQAEAVLDVIRSKTDASLRAALNQLEGKLSKEIRSMRDELLESLVQVEAAIDFPDEDIEILSDAKLSGRLQKVCETLEALLAGASQGRVLREGLTTVIAGRPNVGKSSLLNALLRHNRAIVTPIAGTTRDAIEELANIRGIPVRLVDTAGIQETTDAIEQEGIRRSRSYLEKADLVLLVVDGSVPPTEEDKRLYKELSGKPLLCVVNKADLPQALEPSSLFRTNGVKPVSVSATNGTGLGLLEEAIVGSVYQGKACLSENALLTQSRHKESVRHSCEAVRRATTLLSQRASGEFIASELREALQALGEIVGEVFTEDLLDRIFSQFCIGK